MEQIAILEPKDLVYGDEAGMDSQDDYLDGWNEKGNRFYVLKSEQGQGTHQYAPSVLPKPVNAPFTIEGACHQAIFAT